MSEEPEIQELRCDGATSALFAEGEFPTATFWAAVQAYLDEMGMELEDYSTPPSIADVRHDWWFKADSMRAADGDDDLDWVLRQGRPDLHGSIRVTFVAFDTMDLGPVQVGDVAYQATWSDEDDR